MTNIELAEEAVVFWRRQGRFGLTIPFLLTAIHRITGDSFDKLATELLGSLYTFHCPDVDACVCSAVLSSKVSYGTHPNMDDIEQAKTGKYSRLWHARNTSHGPKDWVGDEHRTTKRQMNMILKHLRTFTQQ